ncbi:phosphotransferase family protein [Streptomyces chartreusis]
MTDTFDVKRARIAALAGRYNLVDGQVPVVDGSPSWPWSEAVARRRLQRVAGRLNLALRGDETLIASGSNDSWLLGDTVLRICWRGDIARLPKEAVLSGALPREVRCPAVLDWGRDEHMSWILAPRIAGETLADAWGALSQKQARRYVSQSVDILRVLHDWTPAAEHAAMLVDGEPTDGDEAVTIAGKTATPLSLPHQLRLIEYARTMPFVPNDLLDEAAQHLSHARVRADVLASPRHFLHGDFTPWNIMVREGEVVALLDYEWARFGPRDADLLTPVIWEERQDPGAQAGRNLRWMREGYPELFDVPHLQERLWFYKTAFALRGMIHWPPDRREDELEPDHPVTVLRRLVATPWEFASVGLATV